MNAQEKWVGSKSLALLRQGPFRRYILGSLHFRQWHVDANDGAKLGHERAYQQSHRIAATR